MSVISNNKLVPAWLSLAEWRARRAQRRRARSKGHLHRSNGTAYLMIAPMVILLAIFVIYPLGYAVWLSGHRISFYKPAVWVGLDFYRYVLEDLRAAARDDARLRVGLRGPGIVRAVRRRSCRVGSAAQRHKPIMPWRGGMLVGLRRCAAEPTLRAIGVRVLTRCPAW